MSSMICVRHINSVRYLNCYSYLQKAKYLNGIQEKHRFYNYEVTPTRHATLLTNTLLSYPSKHSLVRNFSLSTVNFDKAPLKPSSKVEATVNELTKQLVEVPKQVVKKTIKERIIEELTHYYHGFRLLFIDVKISSVLLYRILTGHSLTRREHKLLIRTVGDMFRLLPFSVFIIVPFMEFLLPVFIKLFPGMLPSTFQTATEKQDKQKQSLKVKIEMAKFLQKTLDEMAVKHKDHQSDQAKDFSEWFKKMRTSGDLVTSQEIMKYSKLFEDEITLDSLTRNQLMALCRVLEVQTLGTNNILRFQLRMKLRSLAADDKMISKEGMEALTLSELQAACRARGMRALGLAEDRLRGQLREWLYLSLNEKVPPSLLLLSRALMLPETIPTPDILKVTISSLSDNVVTQTKVAIGEKEGKVDNKSKIEAIREEERQVKEERLEELREELKIKEDKLEELREELKKEVIDKAAILGDTLEPMVDIAKIVTSDTVVSAPTEEKFEVEDLKTIQQALDSISVVDQKMVVEKEKLQELKEEMADYQEDVQDLKKVTAHQVQPEIQESKAAQRLFKSVNKLITKLDTVMLNLENKEQQIKKDLKEKAIDDKSEELLQIDDIMAAIRKIQHVPDESRVLHIKALLEKMDDDFDGSVKVEHVLKVLEMIGTDNVNLNSKQLQEVMELLNKEEILEAEEQKDKISQK